MFRDFRISINEKYQRNKAGIWFIIIVAILIILVIRSYFKLMTTTRGSGVTPTSGSVSVNTDSINLVNVEDDYNTIKNEIKEQGAHMNTIELFLSLCNNKKVNAAYEMLSDDCKSILYPTKQSFVDNYYSVIFKTSKVCESTSFKNDTYKVKFSEDEITTGGNSSGDSGIIDYITIADGGKVNISGLVDKQTYEDKVSQSPYFTIYLKEKQRFVDHTVLKIKVKNTILADIYINDANDNGIYLKDSDDSSFAIDSSNMFDSDYLVSGKAEKEISLDFNIGIANDDKLTELYMGKMIIINKKYYDDEADDEKMTNYPTTYNWTVKL